MISTSVRAALIGAGALLVMASEASAQRRNRNVITRAEIEESALKEGDIHAVIRALRPHMLVEPKGTRTLGGGAVGGIAVYIDRVRMEGVENLKNLPALQVNEVRYLDPARSQNEYGITANSGAIVITRFTKTNDSLRIKPPR